VLGGFSIHIYENLFINTLAIFFQHKYVLMEYEGKLNYRDKRGNLRSSIFFLLIRIGTHKLYHDLQAEI